MSLGLKVLTGKWREGKGIAEAGSLWHRSWDLIWWEAGSYCRLHVEEAVRWTHLKQNNCICYQIKKKDQLQPIQMGKGLQIANGNNSNYEINCRCCLEITSSICRNNYNLIEVPSIYQVPRAVLSMSPVLFHPHPTQGQVYHHLHPRDEGRSGWDSSVRAAPSEQHCAWAV